MASPTISAPDLRGLKHLSWGFFSLQRMRRKESTSHSVTLASSPAFTGRLPATPILPTTVPLSGFFDLSVAFFFPPPSHHFQAANALGIRPFRGFSSHRDPSAPRRQHALLTFLLPDALALLLGESASRRAQPLPRISRQCAFGRLQGFRPNKNRSWLRCRD